MRRVPAPGLGVRGLLVLVAAAGVVGAPRSTTAHDLWMLPGKFLLAPGETTRVFINNGDDFPGSLTLLGAHRVAELVIRGPGWTEGRAVVTDFRVDGRSLTFELAPPAAGVHVLGLETRPRRVRLKPDDFADYLAEERLDEIAEIRGKMGEADRPAVERYTKWAKAMVEVRTKGEAGENEGSWREPLGHRIEILPLRQPNRLDPGETLSFRVLFEEKPLAGARVVGSRAGGSPRALEAITDDSGEASVELPSAGRWHLRTIHMLSVEDDPEVRWESFWCTFSFEVAAGKGP